MELLSLLAILLACFFSIEATFLVARAMIACALVVMAWDIFPSASLTSRSVNAAG